MFVTVCFVCLSAYDSVYHVYECVWQCVFYAWVCVIICIVCMRVLMLVKFCECSEGFCVWWACCCIWWWMVVGHGMCFVCASGGMWLCVYCDWWPVCALWHVCGVSFVYGLICVLCLYVVRYVIVLWREMSCVSVSWWWGKVWVSCGLFLWRFCEFGCEGFVYKCAVRKWGLCVSVLCVLWLYGVMQWIVCESCVCEAFLWSLRECYLSCVLCWRVRWYLESEHFYIKILMNKSTFKNVPHAITIMKKYKILNNL